MSTEDNQDRVKEGLNPGKSVDGLRSPQLKTGFLLAFPTYSVMSVNNLSLGFVYYWFEGC